MKTYVIYLTIIAAIVTSCTVLKVSNKQKDGYFLHSKNAVTLINSSIDLDKNKELIVVPNGVFMRGMVEKISYFDTVITVDDLEKEIIRNGKQDEVGSLSGRIGLSNAYKKYKKFLYLSFEFNPKDKKRLQIKLIIPDKFQEIFVAETAFDDVWAGVNDKNTFNPLFNSLINYIYDNSKTYK